MSAAATAIGESMLRNSRHVFMELATLVLRCNGTPDTSKTCAYTQARGTRLVCLRIPSSLYSATKRGIKSPFLPKAVLSPTEIQYVSNVWFGIRHFFIAGNLKLELQIKSEYRHYESYIRTYGNNWFSAKRSHDHLISPSCLKLEPQLHTICRK